LSLPDVTTRVDVHARVARGAGIWWWWQRRSSWRGKSATTSSATTASQFPSLNSINTDASAREVDYPIVESRLCAVDDLITSWPEVSADARSQPGFLFELYTREESDGDDRPQELESATLDLVLGCASLAAPHGVSLLGIDSTTKSGQLVLKHFQEARYWILGLPCITIRVEKPRCFRARWARKHPARFACVQLVAGGNTDIQPLLDALQNSSLTSLSLAGAGIGVEGLAAIATVIPTMAAIAHVALSGNMITGSKNKGSRHRPDWEYDLDLSGTIALGKAVVISKTLTSIDLSNCGISVAGVTEIAKFISTGAAVEVVVLAQNKLSGRTLDVAPDATVIDTPVIGCFVKAPEGAAEVLALEPVRLKDVATGEMFDEEIPLEALQSDELSFYAAKDSTVTHPFSDLCKGLKPSQVTLLDLSECELGSDDLTELAEYVRDATAAITSINCLANIFGDEGLATLLEAVKSSSVRSLCGLVEGQTTADFSKMNLGPIDCKIMAAEFEFRGFIAVITSINCLANRFGDEGLATLLEAIEGTFVRSLCGLTEGQETADFSGQNLGPIDCKIMSAEFEFRGFMAAVKRVNLSDNKLCLTKNEDYVYDSDESDYEGMSDYERRNIYSDAEEEFIEDMGGWSSLCDVLPSTQIEEVIVANIGMGVTGVTPLAKAISSMAALSSVNLSGNRAIDQESRSALQESVSSRQPTIELVWDKK
jgi:hypothetical protein